MALAMNFDFKVTSVELMRTEPIGSGAYGAVCKARCDKLPCAAKLLYNSLLQVADIDHSSSSSSSSGEAPRSHRTPLNRFKQECELLRHVNHPNVVQFLGTHTDPETNALVLLMELMDENLTHFIENSPTTVPVHTQVDIGYDVALALTYLHSNRMIHRDLSSNNVLLTASGRAKVSDFGMSTIMGNTGVVNSLTLCPGNVSYMPPEALDEPPLYSKALDVFSFGVLLVQVNSRLFPSPASRYTTMDVISPISHQAVEARLVVHEVQRRMGHIQMMDSHSPLLPVVMDCLKNSDSERPSANELCDRLEVARASNVYRDSKTTVFTTTTTTAETPTSTQGNSGSGGGGGGRGRELSYEEMDFSNIYELDDELPGSSQRFIEKIRQLQDTNERLQEKVEEKELELSSNYQILSIRARELQKVSRKLSLKEEQQEDDSILRQELETLRTSCRESEMEMRRLNNVIDQRTREYDHCREQMLLQANTISDLQSIVDDREDYIGNTKAHLLAEMEDNRKLRAQLDKRALLVKEDSVERESLDGWINHARPTKVHEVEQDLKKKEREVKDLKKFISVKDSHITSLEGQLQRLEVKLKKAAQIPAKPPVKPRSHSSNVRVEWSVGANAPSLFQAGSTAVNGSRVYCRPASSGEIYEFSSKAMTWRKLRKCPSSACTLVTIDGILTAVGGMNTRILTSYVEAPGGGGGVAGAGGVPGGEMMESWSEIYPPMQVERFNAAAACSNNTLVVAGGFGRGWCSIADVEVLDVTSRVWRTVQSLPYPIYSASAVICNDSVYVVGGYFEKARGHFSVLSCPLASLTESSSSSSPPSSSSSSSAGPQSSGGGDKEVSMPWSKVNDLPVCRSTCITFRGKLAVIGGRMVNGCHSSTLYMYNPSKNTWTPTSDILHARCECHAAVINDKKLVIAGGDTEDGLTDSVEIGMIVIS